MRLNDLSAFADLVDHLADFRRETRLLDAGGEWETVYFPNGMVYAQGPVHDEHRPNWRFFYPDGVEAARLDFDPDLEVSANVVLRWHTNGQPAESGWIWSDGMFGPFRAWHANGSVKHVASLDRGKLEYLDSFHQDGTRACKFRSDKAPTYYDQGGQLVDWENWLERYRQDFLVEPYYQVDSKDEVRLESDDLRYLISISELPTHDPRRIEPHWLMLMDIYGEYFENTHPRFSA